MKAERPVFWFSGQFLDPQHFQQSDCHNYHQLASWAGQSRPWPWGVNALELNEASFAQELIKIEKADLFFPDGSRAIVEPEREDGNAIIETRSFESIWPDHTENLILYVGLAKMAAKNNVAGILMPGEKRLENLPTATGRFLAAEIDELKADRYALPHVSLADSGAPVRTLYYYLRIFSQQECRSRGDHFWFPLIRLTDKGLGPRLDSGWCPPLVSISASPILFKTIKKFETRLTSLVGHLSPMRPSNIFAPQSTGAINLLSVAAMTLANLKAAISRPNSQPWQLFEILGRGLAGLSACLKIKDDLPYLSGAIDFDHNNPMDSFLTLEKHYARILACVLPEVAAEILFVDDGDILVAELPPEISADYLEPFLVVRIDDSIHDLLVEGRFLAGSPEDVRQAMLRAVPALPLKPVRAPIGLPLGRDIHYLKPDRSSSAWKKVLEAGKFSFTFLSSQGKNSSSLTAHSKLIFIKAPGQQSRQ